MKTTGRVALALVALGLVLALGSYLFLRGHGFSSRAEPGELETFLARAVRRLATPMGVRDLKSPVPASAGALRLGLEHFADHCAMCHANDGSGNTEMGRGLYPKAPDMRLEATQSLTDGDLYYIIENGVPLTGMPAWGTATPDGEAASWHL
ncbi:MAG TPA: c-type cytochrome, partial [Kiloniellales bacterium]